MIVGRTPASHVATVSLLALAELEAERRAAQREVLGEAQREEAAVVVVQVLRMIDEQRQLRRAASGLGDVVEPGRASEPGARHLAAALHRGEPLVELRGAELPVAL